MKSCALILTALLLLVTTAAAQPAASPHGTLATDCRICHGDGSWRAGDGPLDFDHETTGFPLLGAHRGLACRLCHENLEFARVGALCADCHTDAHRGSLGLDCETCHSERGWEDRSRLRELHDTTAFPLRGAHAQADCVACHTGPEETAYVGTPVDCYACHVDEYTATTSPDHDAAGYGHDCTLCHDPFRAGWTGGRILHPAAFPLTGAHARTDCATCHTNGYSPLPTDCYACHQADYDGSTDPGHAAAGFPVTCADCHGTSAWSPATFDHGATAFALTGAHRSTDCAACHADGYTGTPTDCYACHRADYDGTTDPDHAATGFPVSCTDCHGTSAWSPADWDHDSLFPIYSGRHRDEWNSCADCHVTAADYSHFECIFCHEHNRTDTDRDHREEPDYRYTSEGCFDCHPRGSE
jgi:hypothetical protein